MKTTKMERALERYDAAIAMGFDVANAYYEATTYDGRPVPTMRQLADALDARREALPKCYACGAADQKLQDDLCFVCGVLAERAAEEQMRDVDMACREVK